VDVSATVFEILTPENSLFSPTEPRLTLPSGGTLRDSNGNYAPLTSTFNGLQFRRWQ